MICTCMLCIDKYLQRYLRSYMYETICCSYPSSSFTPRIQSPRNAEFYPNHTLPDPLHLVPAPSLAPAFLTTREIILIVVMIIEVSTPQSINFVGWVWNMFALWDYLAVRSSLVDLLLPRSNGLLSTSGRFLPMPLSARGSTSTQIQGMVTYSNST